MNEVADKLEAIDPHCMLIPSNVLFNMGNDLPCLVLFTSSDGPEPEGSILPSSALLFFFFLVSWSIAFSSRKYNNCK